MSDLLRIRLRQGTPTSTFPDEVPEFPARFRGRPAREDGGEVDVGACLFSPEEERDGITYTRDHRLASRTREGLAAPGGEIALATALDQRLRKLLGRSLRLRSVVAGSCGACEAELVALGNIVFDAARFGIQFVASPRHADGIVITGAVNVNMREALLKTYDALPDPRLVIAVGTAAVSGGIYRGSPEVTGIPAEIPVDLWIPGEPPHPLTILDGLLRLLGRLHSGGDMR